MDARERVEASLTAVRAPQKLDDVLVVLAYVESVYDDHRGPEGPEWAVVKPRVEKYLRYHFSLGMEDPR